MRRDDKPTKAKPPATEPPATHPLSGLREGSSTPQPSLEEISSSLLLEDPSEEARAPLTVEELSGSVLLEDPAAPVPRSHGDGDIDFPTLQRPVPAHPVEFRETSSPAPVLSEPPPPAEAPSAGVAEKPLAQGAGPVASAWGDALRRVRKTIAPARATTAPALGRLPTPMPPPKRQGEGTAPAGPVLSPTRPPAAPSSDVEVTRLPHGRLEALRSWLRNPPWRGRAPMRPAWWLGGAGLVLGIGIWILASRSSRETSAAPLATGTAAATPAPSADPMAEPTSAPVVAAPSSAACVPAGPPHVVAPSAVLGAGVEARSFGNDVALGFAPNEQQAIAVHIDPESLSASETTTVRAAGPIRRVTPITTKKGRLAAAVDVEKKGDRLQGRRTLVLDPPLQIGAAKGYLGWSGTGGGITGKLWPLDGDGEVEALRGAVSSRTSEAADTVAIAFRRAGALWLGAADRTNGLAPKRELSRIPGLGAGIGSPTIAANNDTVLAAWADRASADDPWRLRWVRFKADHEPGNPETFTPPPGGNGEQAMSPAVSALPGGRFLLVWTEGPTAAHGVRALTLSADGEPIGAPLVISSEGGNAGQGQGAVGAGGRGLVAFLESDANGFKVVATPIVCPP